MNDSPFDIISRLFATRGGGAGVSQAGSKGATLALASEESKHASTQHKDAEPTGRGDLAEQVWGTTQDDIAKRRPHATTHGHGGAAEGEETAATTATRGAAAGEKEKELPSKEPGGGGGGMLGSITSSLKKVFVSGGGGAPATASSVTAKVPTGWGGCPFMSSAYGGAPLPDVTHSLKCASRPLVADTVCMERLQTFVRSKTVERAVHACGSGAFGQFTVTGDVSKYTHAAYLQPGVVTPVAARFSTTTSGREYPDTARNPRGLAFKFYSKEGNHDVLCINFPTFFVRDGILGPDAVRSQQRNPANFQISFDATLDCMSLVPESMLASLWHWSDHGTPDGWMHMDGYPCHTFKWINCAGAATYVKYKFESAQGIVNLSQAEAQRVGGIDPDYAKRQLWQHLDQAGTAEWIMKVQLMPAEEVSKCPVDPFDSTKIWPESQYPYVEVGRIVLDKNPENNHRDVEQLAFSPGRLVPGIEPTPDPLLHWRLFLYQDAQIHRLGVNYHQIPVNTPWQATSYHPITRDGALRCDRNGGQEPHYYPNTYDRPSMATPSASLATATAYKAVPDVQGAEWEEVVVDRGVVARSRNSAHEGHFDADYAQAREFWWSCSNAEQLALCKNIAFALRQVSRREVWLRWLLACHRTDPALAYQVLEQVEAECARVKKASIVSRKELDICAEALQGKPLVDVNNAYAPCELPIAI